MRRILGGLFLSGACLLPVAGVALDGPADSELAERWAVYEAEARKTVLDLQIQRAIATGIDADGHTVTLTSLNPLINSWFVLEVDGVSYHLENPAPEEVTVALAEDGSLALGEYGMVENCRPWADGEMDVARAAGLPYAPVCGQRLYLRNRVAGNRTNKEAVVDFLRDNVWFGESLVGFIKGTFYEDAYMESGETFDAAAAGDAVAALGKAALDRAPGMYASIGFDLIGVEDRVVEAGAWYAVEDTPGIYASAMQPGMIANDILNRPDETHWLDGVERQADVYLVAFDLNEFEIGYERGTDHPRLDWSPRPWGAGRADWLPGPDGFDRPDPLVTVGMLNPAHADRVAAVFTGGFKRAHGAFRASDKAETNYGHHYGFLSHGVLMSKLHPGLSTIYVLDDGTIGMKTWTEEDAGLLPRLRFARQNGVPLIETDPETGEGVPGEQVRSWLGGNWSGSAEAELRTLRGGACMKSVAGRDFLIYAYFSTATPSAMARTFQAYGCRYGMLLDMNSQEHTYMALFPTDEENDGFAPQHLVSNMRYIDDTSNSGAVIPRFVGFSDNRDFFYLLRKEE